MALFFVALMGSPQSIQGAQSNEDPRKTEPIHIASRNSAAREEHEPSSPGGGGSPKGARAIASKPLGQEGSPRKGSSLFQGLFKSKLPETTLDDKSLFPTPLVRTRENSESPTSSPSPLRTSPLDGNTDCEESQKGIETPAPRLNLETRLRSQSLSDLRGNGASSPTSSPRSPTLQRAASRSFREVQKNDLMRDLTPTKTRPSSRETTPREIFPSIMVDLITKMGLMKKAAASTSELDHEINEEFTIMGENPMSMQPALQMLRVEFFHLINSQDSEAVLKKLPDHLKERASSYFEKWQEAGLGTHNLPHSCETIFDQFWRMNLSVVLNDYTNLIGNDSLTLMAHSALFLAQCSDCAPISMGCFTISGKIYRLLGTRQLPPFYLNGAISFFRAGLCEQSLDCLKRTSSHDDTMKRKVFDYALEVLEQPTLTLANGAYSQLFKYLENNYLALPTSRPVLDVGKFFVESAKLYYRSGVLSQISTWNSQVLSIVAQSLARTSKKEDQTIVGECYLALGNREANWEEQRELYLQAVKSFYQGEAYMECFDLMCKLRILKIEDTWIDEKYKDVQNHVFEIQRRKERLSYFITALLLYSGEPTDNPGNELKVDSTKIIESWISHMQQAEELRKRSLSWFEKIKTQSPVWLSEKKLRLFQMITQRNPIPEEGRFKFLSLTETHFISWINELLEINPMDEITGLDLPKGQFTRQIS